MAYSTLSDNATRQVIDAMTTFNEYRRASREAASVAGGMRWKRERGYEYLVRTDRNGRQHRLGARSSKTETVLANFVDRKTRIEARVASLRSELREAERVNKALRAGRTPSIVVTVLNTLEETGLAEHFTVVGTHALYAYETAAGVRMTSGALATRDVDLLWDARKRVRFISDMERLDASMLKVLRRADPTFERKEGQYESAINAKGFEVDFLRRQPEGDDPHPFRFSSDADDLWPVQAVRAHVLTTAPRFVHPVIGSTGRMALMRTVTPAAFIEFKRWNASTAADRPEPECRRDRYQASIVQALLDDGLLMNEAGVA